MKRNTKKSNLLILLICILLSSFLISCSKYQEMKTEQIQEEIEEKDKVHNVETVLEVTSTKQGTMFTYGNPTGEDGKEEMLYRITQLPFPTFWGGEAYSIITPDRELYLIDGGFRGEDGDRIASYINENGGKVKGWILTHPHVDHIGAFIDYMEENSNNVETVYYAPFTREFFEEEEDPDIYAILNNPNAILFYEFLEMKEKTEEEVMYLPLEQGEQLVIGELLLECHASFDPKRHDVNGNSLVMTISYQDFCFALTSDMTEETLKDMEKEIEPQAEFWNPDILQIPHHGYMAGIASDYLYQRTVPKYALLDCTVEEYENNSVNIQNHVQMIEELGIEVIKRFDGEEGNKILIYIND